MNKTAALIVSALAATTLTGCEQQDEPPSQAEEQAYVEEQASSAVRAQLAEDQKDLDATIKELRLKDPSVKDAYFTYDDKGEKVLHVVREEANGKNTDSVWPLLGGVAAGALGGYAMAQLINSRGGYDNYQRQYPSQLSRQYSEDERRKERNSASAAYANTAMMNSRSSVTSNPSYRSNMNSAVSNTRYNTSGSSRYSPGSSGSVSSKATGIMSNGGGARAASHASSGGS